MEVIKEKVTGEVMGKVRVEPEYPQNFITGVKIG